MNTLVIDVGSSSMRGVLFDAAGNICWRCQKEYQPSFISDIQVEQSSDDWLDALLDISRQASSQQVDALSVTCQRSSVLLVDREGNALCPAMMWQDQRSAEMQDLLEDQQTVVAELTGACFNTVYSGPKMAWFIRHQPELVERAYKFCTIADFLIFHLTGQWVTDETYASRTLLMNLRSRQWEPELLKLFHIPEKKLCRIVPPSSVVGTLIEQFAHFSGLPSGLPVITAGGDQQCGALGQGIYRAGRMSLTMGTGAYLVCATPTIPPVLNGDIVYGVHAVPEMYLPEYGLLTCGSVHRWMMRNLFAEQPQNQVGFAYVNDLIAQSPVGANGCMALPFFQGSGSPDWDPNKRGAFVNLRLSTTRADMARSMMEALAYTVSEGEELLQERFGAARQIRISGGLTRCDGFVQLLTDVLNSPLVRDCSETEHTAIGAWLNAAIPLGLYSDYPQADQAAHRHEHCVSVAPVAENAEKYRMLKRDFHALSQVLSRS